MVSEAAYWTVDGPVGAESGDTDAGEDGDGGDAGDGLDTGDGLDGVERTPP